MDVILPNRSLLIVDKGWLKGKPTGETVSVTSQKKQYTKGRKSKVDDIAITIYENDENGAEPKKTLKASKANSRRNATSNPAQTLQFVNATTPAHTRDPKVRRLVRSHVRRTSNRVGNTGKRPVTTPDSVAVEPSNVQEREEPDKKDIVSPKFSVSLPGSTTPLYGGPEFTIKPRFYELIDCYLDHVAHGLYPRESHLTFNPVRDDWFALAITDEVMLHTTLLAAAIHISTSRGLKTFIEHDLLTERVLRQLNQRLTSRSELTDPTLGAVACLAMLENMQGKYDRWEIHMKGMAKIIQVRGGLSAIGPGLQIKLCRADIEGSVDSLSTPHLSPPPRLHQPIYSTIIPVGDPGPQSNTLLAMLIASRVSSHLVSIYHDLSRFSYALQVALDSSEIKLHPRSFDEDVVFAQYELLTSQADDESELEKALRLGAIMYVKSISRSTPLSPWSSAKLSQKLRSIVGYLAIDIPARLLLVWVCFVGASASQESDRMWFIKRLVEILSFDAKTWTWEDAKEALRKVLWVELIHNDMYKKVWDDV